MNVMRLLSPHQNGISHFVSTMLQRMMGVPGSASNYPLYADEMLLLQSLALNALVPVLSFTLSPLAQHIFLF